MKLKINFNKNGSTLVEVMMATVLIAIAALIMSGMLNNFIIFSGKKDRAIELAMTIESSIVAASQDIEKIRPFAQNLFNGESSVNFEVSNSAGIIVAKNNQILGFDDNNSSCDPLTTRCRVTSEIQIRCFGQVGASHDCRLGYKIIVNDQKGIPIRAFGVKNNNLTPSSFENEDFGLMLAYDVFSQTESKSCENLAQKILTGYNKETGALYCARMPSASSACGADQFPIGISYDSSSFSYIMACSRSWKAHCPDNYAILSVDMSGAISGSGNITCVFVGKKSVPWRNPPTAGSVINKRFCPEYYVTKASCSPESGSATYVPGTCYVYKTCSNPPDPKTGVITTYTCLDYTYQGAQPSAPSVSKSDGSLNASCSLVNGVGECGGYSYFNNTNVVMNGTCELAVPETKPGWWQ